MSFGYYDKPGITHPVIEEAIETVKRARLGSVLFLASAGNSWERRIDFPASHRDVIPIYAGDSKGVFLWSNPAHNSNGSEKLGTFGTDIPPSIVKEIQDHFPKADLSAGTSIATVIAAGIVAMTLSYVMALPTLLKSNGAKEVCAKLYTRQGMEYMLQAMSLSSAYRQHFINPTWYWGEMDKDMDLWVSICGVVDKMNNVSQG